MYPHICFRESLDENYHLTDQCHGAGSMRCVHYVTPRDVLHLYLFYQHRCPMEEEIMDKPCFYLTVRVTEASVPVIHNSREEMTA